MACPKCGKEQPDLYECFKNYGTCYLLEEANDEEIYLHEKNYKIIYPLRQGGMANLYLGEEVNNKSKCVIKEMYSSVMSPEEKISFISMFEVEAFMLISLNHPAIPSIKDFFIEDDNYYIIMEYIEGINLSDLLYTSYKGGFSEEEVISIGIEICDILECLHSNIPPVIHRDINPGNFIKRDRDNKIILLDFGIATIFEHGHAETLIGTPGYIAPELYEGHIDIRSDIFSLGVTLYELLTCIDPCERIPFEFELLRSVKPCISEKMEEIIQKSLNKDIDKRFNSVTEMKEELLDLYRMLYY